MAAQVEVKAGEGTRAGGVGGRLHLSPLADSSNKSPMEAPSGTQAPLIIAPEPCKPVPGPKPRLTPKPFNLEKNPTIRPIPAPKPNPKPRPEPTRLTSSKLDVPGAPKPATTKPAHTGSHRPVPTTPKCPTPASIKPSPKPTSTQTAKPAIQPRKPGPLPTPEKPAKLTVHEPVKSQSPRPGLPQKSSAQPPPAAEWSGTTPGEGERMQGSGRVGAPIVRAKSMGFLSQVERADEKPVGRGKAGGATEAPVPLRPQPKGSKPRPVSAILLPATTQSDSPSSSPSSHWVGRRPLSADLTAKFESIGLSLHRRPGKADSKENTPERGREDDNAPIRKKEREKGTELTASSPSTSMPTSDPEREPKASVPERESEKKGEEEELKSGASIKRRISLLFDSSSSSPTGGLSVAGAEPSPTTQPITDSDIPVGVKQRIKKLTEEIPPMQTPSPKVAFKPRPLPADLTKRFATEKPLEPSSPSPSSLEREGSKGQLRETSQAQGKVEDTAMDLTDGAREATDERPVFQFPQDQLTPSSVDQPGASMDELRAEFEPKGVHASGGMQTVRASLFENVVERHSVHVVEEPGGADDQIRRTVSVRRSDSGDDGLAGPAPTDVGTPASPLRVEHVFNIVSAAGEKRAVVESVPLAQLEDKAMTLRSRRSGADGMTRDVQGLNTPPWTRPQKDLSKEKPEVQPQPQEQAPRYLRVGALMKWDADEMERKGTGQVELQAERGHWVEHDRLKPDGTMQVELEKDRFRESERVEVAAPKRLKILDGDDPQPKPKATYFALTGQMQEPQHVDDHSVVGSGVQDVTVDDFSMKTGRWGSQGPLHRNPSLDAAFSQSSQNKSPPQGFLAGQDQSPMDPTVVREMETEQELQTQRDMDWERHRELVRPRESETLQETERERLMEIDRQREMNSQLLEKQHHAQKERLERQKELERQREAERRREVERQIELKRQRETEKQRERDLERQREMERERQREMERERQRKIERERLKELERDWQREMGRDRLKEFERERQKEVERERQKEVERERQKEVELERERQKELERERQKELERERQKELERERQKELERERLKELERERLKELERERLKELERERLKELERERLKELERERLKELERERLKELERERLKELERERLKELERERLKELERERERELERERETELERERLKEFERERQKQLERERQKQLERERQKEMEREAERQQLELEKQRRAEKERAVRQREIERHLEMERQRFVELEKQKKVEKERQVQMEREKQREMDMARQREMEKRRQRELERARQEMEQQQKKMERQREMESQKEMLSELEKQRRVQRGREEKEREGAKHLRRHQEMERQRAAVLESETKVREEAMSQLKPKVLDLDSVSLGDWDFNRTKTSELSPGRLKVPSPQMEDAYRLTILDIDSFRSQALPTQPTQPIKALPVAGIQAQAPFPTTPQPSTSWSSLQSSSQLEFWEHGVGENSPEPPQKPASKPTLEQLLLGQDVSQAAPSLIPERRWSGLPAESTWVSTSRRDTAGSHHQGYANPAPLESPWVLRDPADAVPREVAGSHHRGYANPAPLESPWVLRDPVDAMAQVPRGALGNQLRQQGPSTTDLTPSRSRSVSRRSAPAEGLLEGPLSRMRSRSAHREKDVRPQEQLKQCVSAEEEGRDTDTLVQETDSQYGTWDTGLRTDDSLTPATPSSDSNLSSSPRKHTPPHTPGDLGTPSDIDTPDGQSPARLPETEPLRFPETSTALLDTSAQRSRVQLGKKRSRRARPSRAARQSAALSVSQEGQSGASEDWMFRDSTEEKAESSKQEESDAEEPPRGAELRPSASQPQRVALFPGMDPSALMAQLKKRGDSDNQTDGASPSASQLSRSPKSPFLARASRVLPPAGGKENGDESSPQWLKDLKSKKRLSQYENDT